MRKELMDPNVVLKVYKEAYQRVQDLERFGVKVREDDGTYFFCKIPERKFYLVSYRGVDTKVKVADEVRKTNTRVIERTMGVDLLTRQGTVIGAVAYNVREGKLTVFLSKATVLCSGDSARQYLEPDGPFLTYYPTTNTGDAQAMGYRSGAKLTNLEYIYMDYTSLRAGGGIAGIKPFDKMGYLVNGLGERILRKEDSARRGWFMVKEVAEGRGPLYWDFRHLPEDVLAIYEREMDHEYPIVKEWFKQRGLDIRKDLIPIQLVPASVKGGLQVNEHFETSLKGLYAAGVSTAYVGGLTESAVSGHIAGEQATRYASRAGEWFCDDKQAEDIEKLTMAPLRRRNGVKPVDLELALRSVTTDYIGYFKSEGLMQRGLDKLLELKKHYLNSMSAKTPHELMRCLEVRNIVDVAEMHFRSSLMRKETRLRRVGLFPHYRVDYPKTDPAWEKLVVIQIDNGQMSLSTQEIPYLKEE
jgi:succinate dehydrogenase/fumarate reductase flavoprotein subunit